MRLKVYKSKGKYLQRIVKLPSDFPNVDYVIVLTEEEYSKLVYQRNISIPKETKSGNRGNSKLVYQRKQGLLRWFE